MNIIIPLGGKGERFLKEGFIDPKPLIKVLNKEILFYTIDNLVTNVDDIIFIIYNKDLDDFNNKCFKNIINEKYPHINLIKLDKETKGASETIMIGLDIIIKNGIFHKKTLLVDGDTFYKENIVEKFRNCNNNAVFYTKNYNLNPIFSYIDLDCNSLILDIKEKEKISDNANTGAYAFLDINELLFYAQYVVNNDIKFNNECYISCIISIMINKGLLFNGIELNSDSVIILGTPSQVKFFIETSSSSL
jgi:hypothetical protein